MAEISIDIDGDEYVLTMRFTADEWEQLINTATEEEAAGNLEGFSALATNFFAPKRIN